MSLLLSMVPLLFSPALAEPAWEIDRLGAWTQLYGTVRFFHPSDEMSEVDLEGLACEGVALARAADSPDELAASLNQLLAPIAPSVQVWTDQRPDPWAPESTDGLQTVVWHHSGVGLARPGQPYLSARTGRTVMVGEGHFATARQSVDATPYRGRTIRLSGRAMALDASARAALWLRVDRAEGEGFFDNMHDRPVHGDWEARTTQGPVAEDATEIVFGPMTNGGGARFDDLQLEVKTDEGWRPIPIDNGAFERRLKGWKTGGRGFEHQVIREGGSRILQMTQLKSELQPPFEATLPFPTNHQVSLGAGLHARIPVVVLEDAEGTLPRGQAEGREWPACDDVDDVDTRVASVAIAWSILQHFYPYFDVVEVDWHDALYDALGRALTAKDAGDHLTTLQLLVAELDDGHGHVYRPAKDGHLPVELGWVEGQVVVLESSVDGIARGDTITDFGSVPAREAFAEARARTSGSPQWRDHRAPSGLVTGTEEDTVTVRLGSGDLVELTYGKRPSFAPRAEAIRQLEDGVFVVDLSRASWDEIEGRLDDLSKAPGIIFDVRGYPTGAGFQILPHLLDEPEDAEWMFVAQRLMPDGLDPVSWDRRGWGVTPKQPHLGAPQVWITGSGAISYAESVLGFVKAHELGPIVGGATAGANGNINPFELPGGYSITWTGMKVLHHDGSQLHLRGIEPTHPVHTTLDGLRLGRDEQLDKAVELVRATSNAGPM